MDVLKQAQWKILKSRTGINSNMDVLKLILVLWESTELEINSNMDVLKLIYKFPNRI